jgi:hypothetical protein
MKLITYTLISCLFFIFQISVACHSEAISFYHFIYSFLYVKHVSRCLHNMNNIFSLLSFINKLLYMHITLYFVQNLKSSECTKGVLSNQLLISCRIVGSFSAASTFGISCIATLQEYFCPPYGTRFSGLKPNLFSIILHCALWKPEAGYKKSL